MNAFFLLLFHFFIRYFKMIFPWDMQLYVLIQQIISLFWQINLYCILNVQFCSMQCALLGIKPRTLQLQALPLEQPTKVNEKVKSCTKLICHLIDVLAPGCNFKPQGPCCILQNTETIRPAHILKLCIYCSTI